MLAMGLAGGDARKSRIKVDSQHDHFSRVFHKVERCPFNYGRTEVKNCFSGMADFRHIAALDTNFSYGADTGNSLVIEFNEKFYRCTSPKGR